MDIFYVYPYLLLLEQGEVHEIPADCPAGTLPQQRAEPPALLLPRSGSHHVRGKHDGTAGHAAGRHRRKDRLPTGRRAARAVDSRCHQSGGTALCLPRTEAVQQRGNLAERPDSTCLPDFRRGREERIELLCPDAASERRRPHLFHRPAPGSPAAEDGHGRREAIPAEQVAYACLFSSSRCFRFGSLPIRSSSSATICRASSLMRL